MEDKDLKQEGVQFRSADILKKEKPKYFSKIKKAPGEVFKENLKKYRKKILLISGGVLVLAALIIGGLILISVINGNEDQTEQVESGESIDLADDVARYLSGNYDGDRNELRQRLEDFVRDNEKDGKIDMSDSLSATLVILSLADLYNTNLFFQDSVNLLERGIAAAPDDTTRARLMGGLVDTYGLMGLVELQIEYLERLVAFPDDAVQLPFESWAFVRTLYQLQLNELRGEEE
ncbi:hypothetical protein FWF89_01360 [Candidatus Saccharibacteria bacterium]|nr:hypothetical protein [Candidatus Saccharibacteria bacterium]